jgi:Predicted dehydrogenases and related proteins
MEKIKIGIIGCGVICQTYLKNFTELYKQVEVVALADMFPEKAKETAAQFGVKKACSVDELIADPEIQIVLNLTIPVAHTEINIKVMEAGKHIFCEKPLALTLEDAKKQIETAKRKGVRLGCAPDTFLGAGIQTCRRILDCGLIGMPIAATANLVDGGGHESWHPNPEFLYKPGAGPMLDMGPYYITALVSLLGAVHKLDCYAKKTFSKRTITSMPLRGKVFDVEVNTHYTGIMEFKTGVYANINMSSDIWQSHLPMLEIYGTEGTLVVPNPNMFGGRVQLLRGNQMVDSIEGLPAGEAVDKLHSPAMLDFFSDVPLMYHTTRENMRGLGLLDMANAIAEGRRHRANEDLVYHVLETLLGFDKSAEEHKTYYLQSSCERPMPLPTSLGIGEMD